MLPDLAVAAGLGGRRRSRSVPRLRVLPACEPVRRPGLARGSHAWSARSPYAGSYALAQRLARRRTTPYAFVAGVQRYLAHGFTYNQHPPAGPAIRWRASCSHASMGYCQQFAGAMAMLLRMGGVPARVAAGFTSGTYETRDHTWVVTDIDAHAWVEAWFPRYGWVRFDPTPPSAIRR